MPQQSSLFAEPPHEAFAAGAWLLRGFALADAVELVAAIDAVVTLAPFRHVMTPFGKPMSVAMSNCGAVGWVSDRRGYRYEGHDPERNLPWPAMPAVLAALAARAAAAAGYPGFAPDACLINRYVPGAQMTLHQDRDERDFAQPIVSVSLGLPAVFLFGGLTRTDRTIKLPLQHGDVVVWGGPSRRWFHGIRPLRDGEHAWLGRQRLNLTFRVAR
ncbi:MAG: DNA oxidative demethylase AlkB [Planctomycetes bacterium]|jgi:alkylated DNA repair protein (DNA oxidative demethylase)|nr:DNA oxidative demethylase AlkB [Planctomycetota bacterium]